MSKLKKTALTLLGLVVVMGLIIGLRAFNARRGLPYLPSIPVDILIENDSLRPLTGQGLEKLTENDNFILWLNFDCGNIELYHRQAGYTWRSAPSEREMALEDSNELWMGNLQSPVVFTFADNLYSMIPRLGNVHNQNTWMQIFELPCGGTRVHYIFGATGIEIGFDLRLTEFGLTVDVPPNLVTDNDIGPFLTEFIIFPFLGATRSDAGDTGYLFLPDGPGALVHFDMSRQFNHSFVEPVYGHDLAYITDVNTGGLNQLLGPMVHFPVYGVHRNDHSLMGIINRGESLADIIGNPAYVQTGFNSAHARFSYRRSFRVITNAQTGEGFFRFTEATFNEYRSLHFHFLTGEDAGWMGMAQAYRRHLVEKYGLARLPQEELPFTVSIIGGDMTQGTLGNQFVSATTFDQAADMLDFFHDQNIGNVNVILYGWQRRGNSVQSPNKYPAARQLGGNSGLRRLISHGEGLGHNIILADNFSTITQAGRGIRLRRDTVHNAQGFTLFGGWHLSATASQGMFDRDWPRLEVLGAHGVVPLGFGGFLLTDFNANAPLGRTGNMYAAQEMATQMQEQAGLIYFSWPQAFLVGPEVRFLNMPLEGTYRIMLDETVPFYHMALHGYVQYYAPQFTRMSEPRRDMLRALAWGALPNFELTYVASEDLWGLMNTHIYSTQFARRRYEFVDEHNRFADAFYLISGRVITDYEEVGDLIRVVFEDIVIYVNLGTESAEFNGVGIPGLDFVVVEG
ncbi:MAG: DUF5696 domain-containing protein [Defluviitaleaceae bacterium]|nr:DUF5696 domain-containing protein [Defluviitaleaceae bacterium]